MGKNLFKRGVIAIIIGIIFVIASAMLQHQNLPDWAGPGLNTAVSSGIILIILGATFTVLGINRWTPEQEKRRTIEESDERNLLLRYQSGYFIHLATNGIIGGIVLSEFITNNIINWQLLAILIFQIVGEWVIKKVLHKKGE